MKYLLYVIGDFTEIFEGEKISVKVRYSKVVDKRIITLWKNDKCYHTTQIFNWSKVEKVIEWKNKIGKEFDFLFNHYTKEVV